MSIDLVSQANGGDSFGPAEISEESIEKHIQSISKGSVKMLMQ